LRIGILGHIALDTISSKNFEISSLGGPPCYAGLAARRLGCDVILVTKVGVDFPDENSLWLAKNNLNFSEGARSAKSRTTRFRIRLGNDEKNLQIVSRCDDISDSQLDSLEVEGAILSPIAGEIPKSVSNKILSLNIPAFLDPQGYLRRFDKNGYCHLAPLPISELPKTTIIKVDPEEGNYLVGSRNLRKIASSLRKRFDKVIVTNGPRNVILASENIIKEAKVPRVEGVVDTTGLGDILSGSFLATFLKTDDFEWSVCVGIAFASLASKGKGIAKVSEVSGWESLAEKVKDRVKVLESVQK
jgi:sugar/nucleoside kinase (ribokinase family)